MYRYLSTGSRTFTPAPTKMSRLRNIVNSYRNSLFMMIKNYKNIGYTSLQSFKGPRRSVYNPDTHYGKPPGSGTARKEADLDPGDKKNRHKTRFCSTDRAVLVSGNSKRKDFLLLKHFVVVFICRNFHPHVREIY